MADLTIQNLTKTYDAKMAVDHISMTIKAGSFVAFLGPNGAGKSTTVGMVCGLVAPTSGQISLGNLAIDSTSYRAKLGVVFQDSVLDRDLTVAANLKLRAQMYAHIDAAWQQQLIQHFGLSDFVTQKYGTLSGGQRRRVDIVRALLHQPAILILDEPSTGLDIQTRRIIWATLADLRRDMGLTVILTTHYLEEAQSADFVYIIDHGAIIAADTVANLTRQYAAYQLKLTPIDASKLLQQLQAQGLKAKSDHQTISVAVPTAQAALAVLNKCQDLLADFECRPGDMNDIFMALTGKAVH
ncbi:MAG: ABC transporter ATP-binding protein [Lactobacillus sp.]|jgi:multidrug/hemolysin transport system ATP-binding protein|nr:ABC transporter ATP-binding protein [Lactobacillus sp.]